MKTENWVYLATISTCSGDYMLNVQRFRRIMATFRLFWRTVRPVPAAIAPLDAQVPAAYNAAMRKEFAIIQRITDPAP